MRFFSRLTNALNPANYGSFAPPTTAHAPYLSYDDLGTIPVTLRGLCVLYTELCTEYEELTWRFRRTEFGVHPDSDEEVPDDHDLVEFAVHQKLQKDSVAIMLQRNRSMVTNILIPELVDHFDNMEIPGTVETSFWGIDADWNLSVPARLNIAALQS